MLALIILATSNKKAFCLAFIRIMFKCQKCRVLNTRIRLKSFAMHITSWNRTEWFALVWREEIGRKMGKVGLVFTLRRNDSSLSLPTGWRILTSTNRHKSKGGEFVKLSQIYKTAIFNGVSFFTPSDPCVETNPGFFFFPPVSGNSWKAKATSWVGEETGEVLTCRQAGDPGKSHRQEEPDWLWPPRSRLGARQLKDVSKPHSDHHRVLQEIA